MEVLSLALLAVASGGLLLKAHGHSKKEGFAGSGSGSAGSGSEPTQQPTQQAVARPLSNNALFSKSVKDNVPQQHKEYIESTTQKYNPFAAIFNPLNVSPSNAPDNETIKNILKPYNTKVNSDSNSSYKYDKVTSDRLVAPYGVSSNTYGRSINYCENKTINTLDDGVSVDCSAFTDTEFSKFCGITHGPGSNSHLQPVNNKGLYITSGLSTRDEQQVFENNRNLTNSNRPSYINWQPTVGSAQPYKFSVDSKTCARVNNDNICSKQGAAGLGNNGCFMALSDQKYYYISPTVTKQPTVLKLKGSGTCSVKIDTTSYVPSGSSTTFTLTSNLQTITIPLDSSGNAADGKTLTITITGLNVKLQGYFVGNILSPTGNTVIEDKRDIAITAIDNSAGVSTNTPAYTDGEPTLLYAQTVNGIVSNPLILSVPIPYCYIDPRSIEATYSSGPFIRTPLAAGFLDTQNCFARNHNNPGQFTNTCLQGLFISAGCTSAGNGFPVDSNTAHTLMYNSNGGLRTLGEISRYAIDRFNEAYLGVNSNGQALNTSNWGDVVHYCLDSKRNVTNVCDMLPSNIKENGPIPFECVNYIFTDGSNSTTNPFGTYDRSSYGNAKSLWNGNLKDRFCTSNGTMAPTSSNIATLQKINPDGTTNSNYVGIESIKQFYRNIHSKANQRGLTNAERNVSMQQCYGENVPVQPTTDPFKVNDIEVAATNCGTKARYLRLNGSPTDTLQVSQIVAIDARGQNVALKKTVTALSTADWTRDQFAVDGTYRNRDSPIYKSRSTGFSQYLQVDFGGVYDIVQVIYYNTITDYTKANGAKLQLFDGNLQVVGSEKTLTSGLTQYFDFSTSTAPYCPKTYKNLRGDTIDPQENIKSEDVTVTNYPVYEITNVWGTSLPDSNAKWIWNDPYASLSEDAGTTTFYTTINNPTYVQIPYTIYYRADEPITLSINEAPIGIGSQSGTSTAVNPGSNVISILPGKNMIKVSITNTTYSTAGFIITFQNNNTRMYENPTNTTNWKSTDPPTNTFTQTKTTYGIYNINPPSTWTVSVPGDAQWIWNQPGAGINAGTENVDFYLSISIGGTSIKTYKIYFSSSDNCTIYVNSLQVGSSYNNISSYTESSFQLVPGSNLINASIYNSGSTAGFIAVIKDDNGQYIYPTKAGGSWTVTTPTLYNETTNPCAYMSGTDTKLSSQCLGSIWKKSCSGSYPSNNFSAFTMSGFSNEVGANWASRTASNTNQVACKGKAVCNDGYTYVEYNIPGFELDGMCQKTIDASTDVKYPGMKPCSDWNGQNCICGECSQMSEQSDRSCTWQSDCWSKGTCAGKVSCGVWHDATSLTVTPGQRVIACSEGYTPSYDRQHPFTLTCTKNYCSQGTLQSNGKCLLTANPNF